MPADERRRKRARRKVPKGPIPQCEFLLARPWPLCRNLHDSLLLPHYTHVLQTTQVEAESQPDVSESFDVDSVPTFVLLRGHTLLSRVSGANASALASAVAAHAASPSAEARKGPSSSTASQPQAAPSTYPGAAEGSIDSHSLHQPPENESEEELFERCSKIMNSNKVMVFMKGNPEQPRCGFSQKTVALLKGEGVGFGTFDILQDEAVRQGMKKLNDWPTFPQIFVQGQLIGGLDILKEQIETGEFKELLHGPGA